MDNVAGKTAVITGAASGIGRALADRAHQERMRLVLADVEDAPLAIALDELSAAGADAIAVKTDVSDPKQMHQLAEATLAAYESVDLLFNNAGVGAGSTAWQHTAEDWTWVMGVNFWSVVYAIQQFVPIMIKQGTPCHIVNTASIAGLVMGHHSTSYGVSKKAVVGLSEQLSVEFAREGHPIGVSVLCPSWVNTRINEGGRNRPAHLQNKAPTTPPTPEMLKRWEELQKATTEATPPSEIADITFDGIKAEKLYILPHDESIAWVKQRFDMILKDIE